VAIYKGSRYTNVFAYDEEWKGEEVTAFRIREMGKIDTRESQKHVWIEGDRLDLLASRYYNDPRYWWFILDANPNYMEEHEIQNGDTLLIPPYEELRKIVVDNG
jgi:hypothetical protein